MLWVFGGIAAVVLMWIGLTYLAGKTHVVIGFRACEREMPIEAELPQLLEAARLGAAQAVALRVLGESSKALMLEGRVLAAIQHAQAMADSVRYVSPTDGQIVSAHRELSPQQYVDERRWHVLIKELGMTAVRPVLLEVAATGTLERSPLDKELQDLAEHARDVV